MAEPAPSTPPGVTLMRLIYGGYAFQTVRALVELGIADALNEGARSTADLARELGLHEPSLRRLLKAAATLEVATAEADDRFRLTPVGLLIRSQADGSLAALARMFGSEHYHTTMRALPDAVRTGKTAIQTQFGVESPFELYDREPEIAAVFDAAMTAMSNMNGPAVAGAYDFSRAGLCVDVGGGEGRLLGHILQAFPGPRGLLFDLPPVAAKAETFIGRLGLAERCAVVGGDMFKTVPEGGDLYLLSAVIHDWEDASAVQVLRACRRAMGADARLLLVERVLDDEPAPSTTNQNHALSDLNMMVRTGGLERTAGEFRGLLGQAGLELTAVIPTASPRTIIEARPV
jgi:hypothetical protein